MATAAVAEKMTNKEFGAAIGVHHSMASRIRGGRRVPSVKVLEAISDQYGIPVKTLVSARNKGPEEFGALIRKRVFQEK